MTPQGDAIGDSAVFEALRVHWSEVMCPSNQSEEELMGFLQEIDTSQAPSDQYAIDTILQAVKDMDSTSVAGPDNWSVSAIKTMKRPQAEALSLAYRAFLKAKCWPTSIQIVRTQMLPKTEDSLCVTQQRPICIMSVWYRLWSRVALSSLPVSLLASLHPRLRGGAGW